MNLVKPIYRLAGLTAMFGALLLLAVMLMIVVSVFGRALIGLGLGPIPGDFEMVEVGTAIAIFFFLPWTSLKGGHATVELLFMYLPIWAKRVVVILSDLLMLIVWLLLTRMLYEGMLEKRENLETTFILAMPVWWAYALCLVGAIVGCLAYVARTATLIGISKEPEGWTTEAGVH
jgi:TRAP-type C4-dicarboxylate transport system permease small subunit